MSDPRGSILSFFVGLHEFSESDFGEGLRSWTAYRIARAMATQCADKSAQRELLDATADEILCQLIGEFEARGQVIRTERPKSLKALLEYLPAHPRVEVWKRAECSDEGTVYRFSSFHRGGLWWRDDGGGTHYTPINCGKTAAETGIDFAFDHFSITKFGAAIDFYYLCDDPENPHL